MPVLGFNLSAFLNWRQGEIVGTHSYCKKAKNRVPTTARRLSELQHHGQRQASARWTERRRVLSADESGPESQMRQLDCGPLTLAVQIPFHLIIPVPYVLVRYRPLTGSF